MGKKIKKKKKEEQRSQVGFGSSIIQDLDTLQYTFVIHQTRGELVLEEPIQCPHWFDDVDKAKTAGSAALRYYVSQLREVDGVDARHATPGEIAQMSDEFAEAFAAIKAAQNDLN
jgi:hypothetical protein